MILVTSHCERYPVLLSKDSTPKNASVSSVVHLELALLLCELAAELTSKGTSGAIEVR